MALQVKLNTLHLYISFNDRMGNSLHAIANLSKSSRTEGICKHLPGLSGLELYKPSHLIDSQIMGVSWNQGEGAEMKNLQVLNSVQVGPKPKVI